MALAIIGNLAKSYLPQAINWGARKLLGTVSRNMGDGVMKKVT